MKRVTVLGVTGSVGRQALELIERFPEDFALGAIAARGTDVAAVAALCRRYRPAVVALADASAVDRLASLLPAGRPELLAGPEGLAAAAGDVPADVVLSAIVGAAGLLPTMAALEAGRTVALANKETLVMAGALMTAAAARAKAQLLPVDSEHSAVFQCLAGHARRDVRRVLLTASGGPFREWPLARLATATVEDALRHPTWRMGPKITVDSATLMNKGLEVIEARWLFDLPPAQIDVVVHPQSIVHSLVEYVDGAMLAQLGVADMAGPILYALAYPDRRPLPGARLDLVAVGRLTFEAPDPGRFPCLALARAALEAGGSASVVLNAANEVAVAAFLERRVAFGVIAELIERALAADPRADADSIDACMEIDRATRRQVAAWIGDLGEAGSA